VSTEFAETVGLQALAWLVSNEDLLPVFLGSTGADATDLAARASDPAFIGSVLEFLTMDDAWVMAFCDSCGLPYTAPLEARQVLPGGATPNWT
jgi:hypothetical protein